MPRKIHKGFYVEFKRTPEEQMLVDLKKESDALKQENSDLKKDIDELRQMIEGLKSGGE